MYCSPLNLVALAHTRTPLSKAGLLELDQQAGADGQQGGLVVTKEHIMKIAMQGGLLPSNWQ